jgi:hypothetical protein
MKVSYFSGEGGVDVMHCQFDSPKLSSAFGCAACGLWKYGSPSHVDER